MPGMKILITGCTGFVGSALIESLRTENLTIYCMSRSVHEARGDYPLHVRSDFVTSLDRSELPERLDCIIHAAATMDRAASPGDMFRINTVSTLDLLQYGKEAGISKFIYLSSGAVYGYAEDQLAEDGRLNPAEFYGLTKYESEFLVQHYRQFFSTSIVRLFFPYGENQRRGLVPRLHECILQRKAITIFNDGNPRINPVYIADVVMAIKYLLGDPEHGIFNLCGDDVVTIKELAAIIAESLDVEPLFTHTLDESVGDLVGCNGLIKQKLQCDALTPLRSGIARFLGNRANTAG